MERESLFIYGTLLEPKVQKEVLGKNPYGSPDTLIGYRVMYHDFGVGVYPIIVPEDYSNVKGSVFQVTSEELKIIDAYETDDYRRELVELESGLKAWVYFKRTK